MNGIRRKIACKTREEHGEARDSKGSSDHVWLCWVSGQVSEECLTGDIEKHEKWMAWVSIGLRSWHPFKVLQICNLHPCFVCSLPAFPISLYCYQLWPSSKRCATICYKKAPPPLSATRSLTLAYISHFMLMTTNIFLGVYATQIFYNIWKLIGVTSSPYG